MGILYVPDPGLFESPKDPVETLVDGGTLALGEDPWGSKERIGSRRGTSPGSTERRT